MWNSKQQWCCCHQNEEISNGISKSLVSQYRMNWRWCVCEIGSGVHKLAIPFSALKNLFHIIVYSNENDHAWSNWSRYIFGHVGIFQI
jgi:hypothetical protein